MTHPVLTEISTQQVVMGQTELHSLISGFYYFFFLVHRKNLLNFVKKAEAVVARNVVLYQRFIYS